MRKHPTWQTTRKALTATAIAAVVTGGAFLTSGTASAASMLAGTCAGSVSGNMGDEIAVQGKSFSDAVKTAAKTKEVLLHLNGVEPDGLAKAISNRGALTVGQIPHTKGGSIGGDVVAAVVTQALQNEGALGWAADTKAATLHAIRDGVTKSCGLTTVATNYVSPTAPNSNVPAHAGTSGKTDVAPSTPGTGLLLGTGPATAPQRDYTNIPAALPGGFAVSPGDKYPSDSPLPEQQSPEIGLLGAHSAQPADVRNTADADAGNANPLAAPAPFNGVHLPMLLAVIALAAVTAALLRTWTRRRVL